MTAQPVQSLHVVPDPDRQPVAAVPARVPAGLFPHSVHPVLQCWSCGGTGFVCADHPEAPFFATRFVAACPCDPSEGAPCPLAGHGPEWFAAVDALVASTWRTGLRTADNDARRARRQRAARVLAGGDA